MFYYLLKRLGQSVIVVFIVVVLAFLLLQIAPGSPVYLLLPEEATEAQVQALEEELGFNKPLPVQFWNYFSNVLRGNLGTSIIYKAPISRLIGERFPNTARLALLTIFTGCILAIPLGIIAGTHRGRLIDVFSMLFALLGQSMSNMWLGVLLIFTFAVRLGWVPATGTGGFKYLILPALTMGYPMAASLTRVARSGMVDTMGEDFITATQAKGISTFDIYTKYALRNAVLPVITMIGVTLGHQLAGAVVTESIFGWSGMGQLLNTSVQSRDYTVVQSLLLVSAILIAIINFIVDIVNSIVDPRLTLN